jgi:hypothetical protein
MTIGYFMANILAFVLSALVLALSDKNKQMQKSKRGQMLKIAIKTYESFYFGAIFLCFSLQIAAWVVLMRTNFGIDTTSMGAYTMRITWAVSLLSFIPLSYGFVVSDLFGESTEDDERERKTLRRQSLYIVCFFLTLYPFTSSLVSALGPSQIGNSPGAAINVTNWSIIEGICLEGVTILTESEDNAIQGFLIFSWLFIYSLTIAKFLFWAWKNDLQRLWKQIETRLFLKRSGKSHERPWQIFLMLVLLMLSVGQLWSYERLEHTQLEMAAATGNSDSDNQWTFG